MKSGSFITLSVILVALHLRECTFDSNTCFTITSTLDESSVLICILTEKGRSLVKLKPGEHRFPISHDLPDSLLPSMKCHSHFVRYYCQVSGNCLHVINVKVALV